MPAGIPLGDNPRSGPTPNRGNAIMRTRTTLAALAALLAFGALATPAAAQRYYEGRPQYQGWRAPTFPWQRPYSPPGGAMNQAALNGDAAIRYQETINAYAHK
ncbi:hypothetical protein Snov_3380 [Ancylobacter novellus DSM 506]|uniref:Uncharacterized protein n=2 Tax=Ancylobacter novellus TaxID=921 RepID=D7A992_ANCN5|nr:hypothetical protein Snov_3380 [Ancylobacter novellus DSM 506]